MTSSPTATVRRPPPSFWSLAPHIATPDRIDRFWSHVAIVEGEGCWLWTGERREARSSKKLRHGGYGVWVIEAGGQWVRFKAHRFAWEAIYGPIPDGLFVLHKCDVRLCCRPAHLWLGTNLDNAIDMMRKGRGSGNRTAKLSSDQVREVRRRLAGGDGPRSISRELGVRRDLIRDIQRGKAYAWVE